MSDNGVYPAFCEEAAGNDSLFEFFRRDPRYTRVLEHVSEDLGRAYLEAIRKIRPDLLAHIEEFKRNDLVGNPICFEYPSIGHISPTTLRYIKVYADLLSLFGSLDGWRICEIGSGYGGQCRIINSGSKPRSYKLVDLPSALSVARWYLGHFDMSDVAFAAPDELTVQTYDLIISNYAFSELHRNVQTQYMENVLQHAKHGYMTCNQGTPPEFESYGPSEYLSKIPNARIAAEEPLTARRNYVVLW